MERAQSIYSVNSESIATAISDTSSTISSQSDSTTIHYESDYQNVFNRHPSAPLTAAKLAEFVSYTDLKRFEGSHLKGFHDIVFKDFSLWICGWNKNMLKGKDTVLVNAQLPHFTTVQKKKKGDTKAEQPTIMALFGKNILFTKANGNTLYSLNLSSKRIRCVYSMANLTIAAICSSNQQLFLLDRKKAMHIKVLDSNFQQEKNIALNIENIQDCSIGMCVINQMKYPGPALAAATPRSSPSSGYSSISDVSSAFNLRSRELDTAVTYLISTSSPSASVRAVNRRNGILWQLDCKSNPELGLKFNPCSLTASHAGDIYFADKGTNRVSIVLSQ